MSILIIFYLKKKSGEYGHKYHDLFNHSSSESEESLVIRVM